MSPEFEHHGSIARWLPEDPSIIWKYHHDLLSQLVENGVLMSGGDVDEQRLSAVILEFKNLIEKDAEIFKDFKEMFKQAPPNPDPDQRSITDYKQLLGLLDKTITTAPNYGSNPLIGAVPMYGILAPFCNTQAGYHVFTNPKVNAMFRRIFDQWTSFLVSPASCNVLVSTKDGWFSEEAIKAQEKRLDMHFDEAWMCDPGKPHKGFTSWDDFFVRRFKERIRAVQFPDSPMYINAACEAIYHLFVRGVKATDEFWLKKMPYSLYNILNYDPLASQFVGGSIYQAMLSSLDYHRWHSPIDGRVVKTYVVPGTYYAARLDDNKKDLDVISRSQGFVTAISTRALIFIESDNPQIGLMCFVGVGLGEVSTTKVVVKEGDRLKKGDEIGAFHFGGSTHLLLFRPETKLTLVDPDVVVDKTVRKVNTVLFQVDQ